MRVEEPATHSIPWESGKALQQSLVPYPGPRHTCEPRKVGLIVDFHISWCSIGPFGILGDELVVTPHNEVISQVRYFLNRRSYLLNDIGILVMGVNIVLINPNNIITEFLYWIDLCDYDNSVETLEILPDTGDRDLDFEVVIIVTLDAKRYYNIMLFCHK